MEELLEQTEEMKARPYIVWKVNNKEYKLKLTTATITRLEKDFNAPLMDAMLDDGIPEHSKLVAFIQCAMLKFQHGINTDDVADLIDDYKDEGNNVIDLLKDVIYPLMYDAGFFTKSMLNSVTTALTEIDSQL